MGEKTPLTPIEFRISSEGYCEVRGAGEPGWANFRAADLDRAKVYVRLTFKCDGGAHNPPARGGGLGPHMFDMAAASEKFEDPAFVEEWKEEFLRRVTEVLPTIFLEGATALALQFWISTLEKRGIYTSDKAEVLKWHEGVERRRAKMTLGMRTGGGGSEPEIAATDRQAKNLAKEYPAIKKHWQQIKKWRKEHPKSWRGHAKVDYNDTPDDLLDFMKKGRAYESEPYRLATFHAARRVGIRTEIKRRGELKQCSYETLNDIRKRGEKLPEIENGSKYSNDAVEQ